MTRIFEEAEGVVDVDSYMAAPYDYWRFEVDTEKAVRRGISVDSVNQNLAMAMGGFKVGDVKRGSVQEPTWIVIQVPLAYRAQLDALGSLPVMSPSGEAVPLVELGRFVKVPEDPILYHIDLRPMEYVVGEMEGRLGAPIYGMLNIEDLLADYRAPDGVEISGMPMGLIGPPDDTTQSGFEWSGEWTVTYETFRDMGLAFMAALVLIYGLIVWEFRNFALAGLIMSPIPLTLLGIVPGHLIMGAEFTATSMIGLIALGGIIVRQSILIVEFVKIEAAKGKSVTEAAVLGAEVRMRPILITSLTTAGGAWTLISDPIFQGMAVSIFFGAGVGTLMAVIVIPLGCISAKRQFYLVETVDGDIALSERYAALETDDPYAGLRTLRGSAPPPDEPPARPGTRTKRRPILLLLWGWLVTAVLAMASLVGSLLRLIGRVLGRLRQRGSSGKAKEVVSPKPAAPVGGGRTGGAGGTTPASSGPGDAAPPASPGPSLATGVAASPAAAVGAPQAEVKVLSGKGLKPPSVPAVKKTRAPRRAKPPVEDDASAVPQVPAAPSAARRKGRGPGGPKLQAAGDDGAGTPPGVPGARLGAAPEGGGGADGGGAKRRRTH